MTLYYNHGGITIYHARCQDVLPTLADASVDLVLTDPPYEAEAHTLQRRQRGVAGGLRAAPLTFDALSDDVRQEIGAEVARIGQRWVLTFCQIEAAPLWRGAYEAGGLEYVRTCIWVKPDGAPQFTGDRPGMGYEAFVAMHPKGHKRWNGGGRRGVWIQHINPRDGNHVHQTQKPLLLIRDLVRLFSDPGDLILDPFMGSGTTLQAARLEGRRAIGIEMEERWCEYAARRLERGDTAARAPHEQQVMTL